MILLPQFTNIAFHDTILTGNSCLYYTVTNSYLIGEFMKNCLTSFKKMIWIFSLVLFILLSGYVLFQGIFFWDGLDDNYQSQSILVRGLTMMTGLFCFALFFVLLRKLSAKFSDKTALLCSVFGFILLFVLQMVFLIKEPCLLRYDALKVFDEALSMFQDGSISPKVFGGYFSRYTNNYAITLFAYATLKLFSLLGLLAKDLHNALFLLQLVNVLFVDFSFWFGFLLVRSFTGPKNALVYLSFVILSPLSYVWLPFFYTNSISMFFGMGSLYLLLEVFLHQKRNPLLLLLSGLFIPIGFFIRATQVIFCIALIVFLWIAIKEKIRKPLLAGGCILLGLCLSIGGYKLATQRYTTPDSNAAFPAIHWIAMGLNEQSGGTFDTMDESYTMSFESRQGKKDADKRLLTERFSSLGINGVARLYFDKLKLTFSDGTGRYPTELGISNSYDTWYQNVYGNNRFLLQYFCQLMYLLSLLFCIIGAFVLLLQGEHFGSPAFCIYLSMLGGFLFHMLWEAGTIYSIGFICLFYAGFGFALSLLPGKKDFLLLFSQHSRLDRASDTHEETNLYKAKRKDIEKLVLLGWTSLCVCTAFISYVSYDYAHYEQERRVWLSVNQYLFQADSYEPCTQDMVLTQSFTAEMPFDEIYLQAENTSGDTNDSVYRIALRNENNDIISSTDLYGKDVTSYALTKLDLHSDVISTDHTDGSPKLSYRLTIQKIAGNDTLSFLYYDTGNYDAYRDGELTGLKAGKKPDLCFIVLKVLE